MNNQSKLQRLLCVTVCFFCIGIMTAFAQEQKVTVELKNTTLKQVFKSIEGQTTYRFSYRNTLVDDKSDITISKRQVDVSVVLNEALKRRNLTYTIVSSKSIVISDKSEQSSPAKTKSVSGIVKSSNGESIIGANVTVEGTTIGCITDIDGNFILEDVPDNANLTVSYIGFQTQSVSVIGKSSLNVILKEDTEILEEVVVVGYGTQKKVNLTGAVASVKMDDVLGNRPVNSALEALEGNIPGLQINKNSGKPGVSINTNIRGVTSINGGSPLVLVDNVPMDLDLVDPNDIESVSVLKDAAASAIYGARAAFGVILVTTKQGKKDTPVKVTYSNNFSFSQVAERPEMVTPGQTLSYFDDLGIETYFGGQNVAQWKQYLEEYEIEGKYPEGYVWGEDGYRYNLAHTDAYDDMLDNFGFQQQHNVSLAGGSSKTSYRISMGATDSNGILVTDKDSYTRYNASSFVSLEATPWLTAQSDIKYTNTKMSTATGSVGNYNIWGSIGETMAMAPLGVGTRSQDDPTEYYFSTPRHAIELHEPVITRASNIRLLGRLIVKPLKDWTITGEYTYNRNWGSSRTVNKTVTTLDSNDWGLKTVNGTSSYTMKNQFDERHIINIFSTYEKKLGQHNISLMGGFNQESYHFEMMQGTRKSLINPDLPSFSQSNGDMQVTDQFQELALRSLFFRLNYSYKDRYLFEANGRYDGSSRFPKNDRFGFFPSFSAAWRISEESFWENIRPVVNNFKLRGSWGNIGNQNVGSYYPYISTIDTYKPKWILPGQTDWVTSFTVPALVSSSFTWETVSTINVGLDLTLFDCLSVSGDYYIRDTKDMLANTTPLPSILGTATPKGNVASLRTRGWELNVTWNDKIGNDFSYSLGLNLYDSTAEITDYYNPTGLLTSGSNLALRKGMKYGEIWGYETERYLTEADFNSDGTIKEGIPLLQGQQKVYPGDVIYIDQDKNGEINVGDNTISNPGDQIVIGNRTPRYQYGITGTAKYKDFDFSIFFNGVGKRDMWLPLFPKQGEYVKGIETYMLDHWTSDNPDAFYPRISAKLSTGGNTNRQTKYVRDGSYLRLKNITVGYNVPKSICKKMYLASLRAFFSAENLFTFHHLPKGYMPDAYDTSVGGLSIASGMAGDSYSGVYGYPLMKQFSFGVNVSF